MVNLTERILMSPAVKKMLTFRHNPNRMIQKVTHVADDMFIQGEKYKHEHRKKHSKSTAEAPPVERIKNRYILVKENILIL